MLISGLVSVSFRALSCEEIITLTVKNGLKAIEWGADVHVPPGFTARARAVGRMTAEAGLTVAAYGSYYRLGQLPTREQQAAELQKLVENAGLLGTDTIRIWAGSKGSADVTESERQALIGETIFLGGIAAEAGVHLCFECHPHTLTDERDAALFLLQSVDRDNVKTYWQPNQYKTASANRQYLQAILPWLTNLHVFHWHGEEKLPLALAADQWRDYLTIADSDGQRHYCLLEFMPDGKKESLPQEADCLNALI